MIKSINFDQEEIINNILWLHNGNKPIDLDVTYSKGNFYKSGKVKQPMYKSDLNPQHKDVRKSNANNLPFESDKFKCIMFDPPFLATTGKSLLSEGKENNAINKRMTVYPDEKSLHEFYIEALNELNRVLKDKGILILKCQDKVSSGKQYFMHCFVYNEAIKAGFYPVDLFILLAKNRLVADWQIVNQKHARKFHCYFWVLRKIK